MVREEIRKEIESGITQRRIAREVGVSQATLSLYLKEEYQGNDKLIENKLRLWLDGRRRKERIQVGGPGFVTTPTSEKILTALRYAHTTGDVAVIYGAAGVGKTRTLMEYKELPNVWLVTMTSATVSVMSVLEEIALSMGLKELPVGAARIFRELVKKLRGTGGLLIVDEAQHVSVPALEAIRGLHDAAGIGLALVGNESVYARLSGGVRAAHFAQLFSRIGKRLHLLSPLPKDVEDLAGAWGVEGKKEVRELKRIAASPGALRAVVKTLRLATLLARGEGGDVAAQHIGAAWSDLGGVS